MTPAKPADEPVWVYPVAGATIPDVPAVAALVDPVTAERLCAYHPPAFVREIVAASPPGPPRSRPAPPEE